MYKTVQARYIKAIMIILPTMNHGFIYLFSTNKTYNIQSSSALTAFEKK